jgi:cytochrome c oxidase subunit III
MSGTVHTATDQIKAEVPHPYHLVDPSIWPLLGAVAAMTTFAGIILAAHLHFYYLLGAGLIFDGTIMYVWWRDVVREARTPGLHQIVTQIGLRYGMALFISSEVMFFVSFFWNYFNYFFYPDKMGTAFAAVWPPQGVTTIDPFAIPLFNTMVLLLSGTTVTWAHHCLLENDQKNLVRGLGVTIILGLMFLCGQAWEYTHSPFPFYHGGIFSSSFFIATGFHGLHVIIGTIFLIVCFFRARSGQFSPERHFGFEAAAWYWHFVDVVWLFLFVCIYFLGRSAIVAG